MSSPVLYRQGRVIDPSVSLDRRCDLLVVDGRIAALGGDAQLLAASEALRGRVQVVDCSDLVVTPGFVDLHVHLREPGQEYKEDLASGGRAAAAGGFTTVCCMPNTTPPNDNRAVTELIVRRAREAALVRVHPIGAISKGQKGETLAEMGEMREAGIVAVSDDGHPVMNAELMRRALEYARTFDLPVVQHAEDLNLSGGGVMNEGVVSTRLGLRGQPPAAEAVMVARDLELVAWTGARYHVAHVSTAASVRLLRDAKQRGLPVTAEVTPHHLTLTDEACLGYDTACKCAPPLRTADDVAALRAALADGIIDCIATDHAPHAVQDKQVEFDAAAFGMTGLETALGLGLRLVEEGHLSLPTLVARLTSGPARIFGLDAGTLRVGAPADLAIFSTLRRTTIDRARMASRSRNTPFAGWTLPGQLLLTCVAGAEVFRAPDAPPIVAPSPLEST